MYKVFINQNVIVLTNKVQFGTKITVLPLKETSLDDIIKKLKKRKTIFLYHHNPNKLISHFKKKLKLVRAGGGIVKNHKDETLFIYRRDKWDLPKGKMDKGESIEETALREVEEETGVKNLIIIDLFKHTYHIFKKGNKHYLKETTWFNMKTDYDDILKPEFKEEITKVIWKSKKQIKEIKNTYPNIKLLLEI